MSADLAAKEVLAIRVRAAREVDEAQEDVEMRYRALVSAHIRMAHARDRLTAIDALIFEHGWTADS